MLIRSYDIFLNIPNFLKNFPEIPETVFDLFSDF